MRTQPSLESCVAFIQSQAQSASRAVASANGENRWHAVTISRQTGSGGHMVAEQLAKFLQANTRKKSPWAVFDRNLMEKVLEDHQLPARLARFMPEDRISDVEDTLDDLIGVRPPSWTLIRQTAETVLHLAELGNVILIGRGATVITGKLNNVFHVRLVGSVEKRARHIQEVRGCGKKAALELIRNEDRGRQRYLKKYFGRDVDNPLLYHLMINTDLLGYTEAADVIGRTMLAGCSK